MNSIWFERRQDGFGYSAAVVVAFLFAYTILMATPFIYDKWNRELYETAKQSHDLIIQEFSGTTENAIERECAIDLGQAHCSPQELYNRLSTKRLIALDYVEQMENRINTSASGFALAAIVQLASLVTLTAFFTQLKSSHTIRFVGFISVFMGTLIAFHVLSDLPHKNTKYYYVFGGFFALLIAVSDFFHRLDVTIKTDDAKAAALKRASEIAKVRYSKWTSVFQFSLGLLAAVVGTISFTLLGYLRTIFGESFIFNPLLGILFSMVYLAFIFYFGIVRSVLLILNELEENVAEPT